MPTATHVEAILQFGEELATSRANRLDGHLLVHCHMGVSRSTAGMLSLLAQLYPDEPEANLFERLRRIRPQAWPNSVMIGYGGGDFLLVRHGRGEVAWEVVDVSRPAGVDAVPVVMVSRYDAHLRLLDARAEDDVSARYEPRLAEWYRLAAAQDALVVTAPGMLPYASRPGVTYARRNGAEVFAVNVGLDNLAGLLARAPVPAGSRLQIADGAGRVVAGGGRPDGAGADVMAATLRMSAGSTARRSVHDETGAGWQVSAAPLRGFGEQHWTLAVATPDAADVAAATCGFACVLHIPNMGMFTNGTQSFTVAASASSPGADCRISKSVRERQIRHRQGTLCGTHEQIGIGL